MTLSCMEQFSRFILIIFNSVFLLSGIAVLAVGIYIVADPTLSDLFKSLTQLDSTDPLLKYDAYILIGFGCFVLLVSILGFIGACCVNRGFLGMYIAMLTIIFIGEFAAGIMGVIYQSKVKNTVEATLYDTLSPEKYENSPTIKQGWDLLQVALHCCGSYNYTDYSRQKVHFNNTMLVVPMTCCKLTNSDPRNPTPKDLTTCQTEASRGGKTSLYTDGCYDTLWNFLKTHLPLVIGIGMGIAFFQLLGIVLACCMCCRDDDNKVRGV